MNSCCFAGGSAENTNPGRSCPPGGAGAGFGGTETGGGSVTTGVGTEETEDGALVDTRGDRLRVVVGEVDGRGSVGVGVDCGGFGVGVAVEFCLGRFGSDGETVGASGRFKPATLTCEH